ncbi:retrovirus-related pol polyprotein from transposon TNT 1-94 [Tanacetum coccineum]
MDLCRFGEEVLIFCLRVRSLRCLFVKGAYGCNLGDVTIIRLPAAKGQVFSLTKDQAANSSGTVSGTLFLNGRVSDHENQNCPLQFDDKIRYANLFPLGMNDFDSGHGFGEEVLIFCLRVRSLCCLFVKGAYGCILDDNDPQDKRQDRPEEEEVEPRRSKRARTEKSFTPDFVSFMEENEPTSYQEAVTSLKGPQWKAAIKSEIDSILQNHTWELVALPPGCKPLGYKWIFKKKTKANGTIDKCKARLVIKRFKQREGLDYFDTHLPITRITSIGMILVIVSLRNLEVHQMDMKTAFINADLEKNYM